MSDEKDHTAKDPPTKTAHDWLLEGLKRPVPEKEVQGYIRQAVADKYLPEGPRRPKLQSDEPTEEEDRLIGEWFRRIEDWNLLLREALWARHRIVQALRTPDLPEELTEESHYQVREDFEMPAWVLEFYIGPRPRRARGEQEDDDLLVPESVRANTAQFWAPTDLGFDGLVKYLGNHSDPVGYREYDGHQYAKLQDVRRASVETSLHVRHSPEYLEVIAPENVESALAQIQNERNETKAKTLLAAFGLASDQRQVFDPTSFEVDLRDFVKLVSGYQSSGKKKTQTRVYWRKVAEILRYLHVDLATLTVSIRVIRRKGKTKTKEEWRGEYLMHRPRLISQQPFAYEHLHEHLRALIVQSEDDEDRKREAVAYLQQLKPTSVVLGFPIRTLKSFGQEQKAVELTNPDVIALKGPAFWLAYDITFRRRWAKKAPKAGDGTPLLDVLDEHGFLEESTKRTGGRVSYSRALTSFFASVEALLDLGELDEPGVRVWKQYGGPGRPKDVTRALKEWAADRGKRIGRADLEPLKVAYEHRADRRRALEEARSAAQSKDRRKRKRKGETGG